MPKASPDLHASDRSVVRSGSAERERSVSGLDPRMHDALTDLHAYALILDAEWQRLDERQAEPTQSAGASLERDERARRRAEMTEELQALRAATAALREVADPAGNTL